MAQNGTSNGNYRHGRGFECREYRAWSNMRARCRNTNSPDFKYYGGRGIRVCERWDSFVTFYADMGDCPPGHSIDRIDNDRGYEPGNCRWADAGVQSRNRRIPHWSINVGSAHGMAKITDDIARAIYLAPGQQWKIAAQYGVSQTLVSQIKTRKIWRHVNA